MRYKLTTVLAVTTLALGTVASSASASVPSSVMSQWKKLDAAFAVADGKWSKVLEQQNPSVAALSKACLAFVPAIKTFDSGLAKIDFTGKTKTDIDTVIKLNNQSLPILSHVTSLKGFEKAYSPLIAPFEAVQVALGKDLGIPAAEVYI